MQAKIYIGAEALATVNAIKNLDYYDRVILSDDRPLRCHVNDLRRACRLKLGQASTLASPIKLDTQSN